MDRTLDETERMRRWEERLAWEELEENERLRHYQTYDPHRLSCLGLSGEPLPCAFRSFPPIKIDAAIVIQMGSGVDVLAIVKTWTFHIFAQFRSGEACSLHPTVPPSLDIPVRLILNSSLRLRLIFSSLLRSRSSLSTILLPLIFPRFPTSLEFAIPLSSNRSTPGRKLFIETYLSRGIDERSKSGIGESTEARRTSRCAITILTREPVSLLISIFASSASLTSLSPADRSRANSGARHLRQLMNEEERCSRTIDRSERQQDAVLQAEELAREREEMRLEWEERERLRRLDTGAEGFAGGGLGGMSFSRRYY